MAGTRRSSRGKSAARACVVAVLVLAFGAFWGAARARAVTVTDLGPVVPLGLNSSDQVVGDALNSSTNTNHAELWSGGTLSALPEPSGASGSDAYEINQAGRIVGDDVFPVTSEVDAIYWDPGTTATRIPPVQTGGATDFSQANSVDVAGDMVGRILSGSMPPQDVGFIDHSGALTFVGGNDTPQNGASVVGAITPDGSEMLGEVTTTSTYYLWSAAAPHGPGVPLDITPTRAAVANLPAIVYGPAIENDLASDGTVLGFKGPNTSRTFWLRAASGTETQITGLNPFAVNSSHTVAGLIQTGDPSDPAHAGIWSGGTVTNLNTLLPPNSGWNLVEALAINDNGDIAGLGVHDGVETAFLLSTGGPQLSGKVLDRDGNAISGITLTLTGTDDNGATVQRTTTTNVAGFYSFTNNPGTYTVTATGDAPKQNGGSLAASQCDGSPTSNACALVHAATGAQLTANFTYTLCDSTSRDPNGSPVTGCPIIFIPGFLGTKIACDGQELWPNFPRPDFPDMQLATDGFTDAGAPGTCGGDAAAVQGPAGLVSAVAGADVYGSTFDYVVSIAGAAHMDVFTFDWRRSPQAAVDALDQEVDRMLVTTGANRVVIMAHSMGGLVTRAYIDSPAHADKVERVLTLGTPYWGAPKAIFALLEGDTETPALAPLDVINISRPGFAKQLQAFARNAQGMYWLYPSNNYGPWMTVSNLNSSQPLAGAQLDQWIQALGGTSALLDNARAGHQQLDGFKTNGIDYQVMVGTGLATPTKVYVNTNTVSNWQTVHFGSGDGTVPAVSGTQGAFNGGAPLGADVPIHYVCGVPHMALGGDPGVDARIENFLLKGSDIPDSPADNCPYSGNVVEVYGLSLPAGASISSAGHSMSVTQAVGDNLVTVLRYGGRDTIITDDRLPVTLSLHGRGMAIAIQRISSHGDSQTVDYGPVSGSVDVAENGAVFRGGAKLRPIKRRAGPPITTAWVKRHGKRYIVTLRARGSGGVGAIFYRIGKQQSHLYTKPLILTAAQVRALRFASVSAFGRSERVRRIRRL